MYLRIRGGLILCQRTSTRSWPMGILTPSLSQNNNGLWKILDNCQDWHRWMKHLLWLFLGVHWWSLFSILEMVEMAIPNRLISISVYCRWVVHRSLYRPVLDRPCFDTTIVPWRIIARACQLSWWFQSAVYKPSPLEPLGGWAVSWDIPCLFGWRSGS